MKILKKIAVRLAQTRFASSAIEERADLVDLRRKPTVRNYVGIALVLLSNLFGFSAIGLLGALSVCWNEPRLILLGGPLLFIFSHLLFLTGTLLAGREYLRIIFRWATRIVLEKLM